MKTQLVASLLLAGATLLVPLGAATAAAQPETAIILQVDRPMPAEQLENLSSFGGWAVDQSALTSPGVSRVAVYMDGDATTGRFLGLAQLGGSRPDVAAQLGNPNYTNSGWNFNLAPLGLIGQHSFTFVATGTGGVLASKSVDSVALVPTAPPIAYQSTVFQPVTTPTYTTPTYTTPAYNAPVYTTPTYTTPAPAPAYTYNPGAYGGAGSNFLAPPPLPVGTVPGMVAPPPVTLSLSAPTSASTAGGSIAVSGNTSFTPASGTVTYTLTDQSGRIVTSGSLGATGVPGQPGTFSGTINYPPGVPGPATLTVTQTEAGSVLASTSATITLATYTVPTTPYYFPYYYK